MRQIVKVTVRHVIYSTVPVLKGEEDSAIETVEVLFKLPPNSEIIEAEIYDVEPPIPPNANQD